MVADPKSHKYRFLFLITILMIVFLLFFQDDVQLSMYDMTQLKVLSLNK